MAMAVDEDAEQEVAPQNKKSPTEDEKRYIYMNRVQCDVTLLRYFSLKYFDKSIAGVHYLVILSVLAKYQDDQRLVTYLIIKILNFKFFKL